MYAGVEGGTSSSKAVIVDDNGVMLGMAQGPHTNHWSIGLEECARRLASLIQAAKEVSGLSRDTQIDSVGLTLSGIDTEENALEVKDALVKVEPLFKDKVFVANDAVGAMMTASDQGGVIVISGTGTVGTFVFPDGSALRVGGMGHMLGDEGSAYWIAHFVIMKVMRHEMGLKHCHFSIDTARKLIFQHFNITQMIDTLPYFYSKFEKSFVAKLCIVFAKEAELGDELCQHAFYKAGVHLARLVAGALYQKSQVTHDNVPQSDEGHLRVLCNGDVWKAWDLLRPGFMETVQSPKFSPGQRIREVTLLRLEVPAAVGAACLGAKQCLGKVVHCDYSANSKPFFHSFVTPAMP